MLAIRFFLLVALSLILIYTPYLEYLGYPFVWMEAYFHELSHGLATTLTGGSVQSITIDTKGNGLCVYYSSDQNKKIILFFGYAGATIWGALIYSGAKSSVRVAQRIALVMMIILISSGLFWMKREFESWSILLVMLMIIFIPLWFVRYQAVQYFVQFIGIFIMVNNIQSVMKLFVIRGRGDHLSLAKLTGVSPDVWVWSWLVFSLAIPLYFMIKTFRRAS